MAALLVFILGLPLAVYTLAGFFTLLDFTDKARALLLITIRILLNVILLLVAGADTWPWLLSAYGIVSALHLLAFTGVRVAINSGRWISKNLD
jgi:hypothetical protein